MENSHIEWTDHTFNPWVGCTKISPGCEKCYAEARDQRFAKGIHWGKGAPRQRTSASNWKQPLKWNREYDKALSFYEEEDIGPQPRRPRVFCASLADWLDDEVPIEWLADLLTLIHATPNLDWLMLTKRPENWAHQLTLVQGKNIKPQGAWEMVNGWLVGHPPHNVWIGTTTENQEYAVKRIPELLKIPARVRFLSVEPMLGPVNISSALPWMIGGVEVRWVISQIQWVICGGESGPGARPMNLAGARSLHEQCKSAGVPFFMKQLGGVRDKRGKLTDLPEALRVREFPTP